MDISVIIPTYNRLWALPRAIESCLGTTCKTEIVVIDDGSDDGTWAYLNNLSIENLVTVRQPNWGKCWAVNKGFAMARGKYVRFLDSDDQLPVGAIDGQFQLLEKTGADIAVAGHATLNEKGEVLCWCEWEYCDDFIAQQLGECDSSHYAAYLFRKAFIDDIPHRPDYALRDDRLFVLEVALRNPKVAVYPQAGLIHINHSQERLQLNSGIKSTIQNYQHLHLYNKILSQLELRNELTQRRKNASINNLWPLARWMAKVDVAEAQKVVDLIYQLNPSFVPAEKGLLGNFYRYLGFTPTERILQVRRMLKRVLLSNKVSFQ